MIRTTRRRLAIAAAASLIAPVAATVATSSASAATSPYCGITWGSLAKTSTPLTGGRVVGIRSGKHTCFDRIVLDIGRGPGKVGYAVRYVSSVTSPGSGLPVAVTGGAKIQITVNAWDYRTQPLINYTGWQTFRQLKGAGSYEGYSDYGLGVRARLPMRAFTLTDADGGGQRLVIDVAHRW